MMHLNLPQPLSRDAEARFIGMLNGSGREEAKTKLVEHNLRLVLYVAKKFSNTGICIEDLYSIGTIGLIKAVNTFNSQKMVRLATYASRCVSNEILMYLRRNRKHNEVAALEEPLNIDVEGNELRLEDILADASDIQQDFEDKTRRENVLNALDGALNHLCRRDRELVKARYGYGTNIQTQKDFALEWGISQSYVSRLEKQAYKKLKQVMEGAYAIQSQEALCI